MPRPVHYSERWDLTTVPDAVLLSEVGHRFVSTAPDAALLSEVGRRRGAKTRNRSGGKKPSCACGSCQKCKAREYQRQRRGNNAIQAEVTL